jgi:RsiW-degrading membrane proteinase PrsW (M82 family)
VDPTLLGYVLLVPSLLAAVVPMLVLLALVWWLDRYEREPVWLFVLTFLWGAIGGVLFGIAGSLALELPLLVSGAAGPYADAIGPVVVAPLAEEPAKAMFLLIVLWNRGFDEMTDGFVYGAAAGLGFGMTENFMYFMSVAFTGDVVSWVGTVVIRTLYSAVMHAGATSIVGAAIGFARFKGCLGMLVCGGLGLALAMSMHATWNGLVTLDVQRGDGLFQTINLVMFPFEILVLFTVFQLGLLVESRTIRRELDEEAKYGVMPAHHASVLSSWTRRHGRSWLPRGVDHRRYVRAATTLALRKSQARQAGPRDEFYRDEVLRLRRQVELLLAKAKGADADARGVTRR